MIIQGIEKFTSKLLVEGNDDQHVVWNICEKFKLGETFGVKDCQGVDELFKQIPLYIKNRDKNLGILIDADDNLQAKWEILSNILTPLGYLLLDQPEPLGSIVYSNKFDTIVGIWIMPNNQITGMLEDFVKILIPESDALISYAEKIISKIEDAKIAKFSNIHRSKALIHTWLAWQESPGTPMGQAITKSYLDHNHELCIFFIDWLNRLFNPVLLEN